MNEESRQRKYLDGLRLVEEAFSVLREPLDIDEQPGEDRAEVQIALQLTGARDKLRQIVFERERQGIKAAKGSIDCGTF